MSVPDWPQRVIPPSLSASPPVGAIVDWPAAAPPAMWAICDGHALSPAVYVDLFNVIGYSFGGSGDSFNLPDLRDRATVGAGAAYALGAKGGAATVALSDTQTGQHTHSFGITSGGENIDHTHPVSITSGNDGPAHAHPVNITSAGDLPGHSHQYDAALAGAAGAAVYVVGATGVQGATYGPNAQHNHAVNGNTGNPGAPHAHNVNGNTTGSSTGHVHQIGPGATDPGTTRGFPHENMPPFAALYKIIRVEAVTSS